MAIGGLSSAQIERLIGETARDAERVVFTYHARIRMRQRRIRRDMVVEVLRKGRLTREPEPNLRFGSLECRMERYMAGRKIAVIDALAAIICGYLIGSIPVGLLLGRLTSGVDVREYGSGKTGFTNSLRVLGLRRSVWVFAGDFAKGATAALVPLLFSHDPAVRALAALPAVIRPLWPVFAGFRGGGVFLCPPG